MFPGNPEYSLLPDTRSKFENSDYIYDSPTERLCLPIYLDGNSSGPNPTDESNFISQRQNQWMYFRLNNAFNGEEFYEGFNSSLTPSCFWGSTLSAGKCIVSTDPIIENQNSFFIDPTSDLNTSSNFIFGMLVYPRVSNLSTICMTEEDTNRNYKLLLPGEALQIPITVKYKLGNDGPNNIQEVTKTISFDLRNSLYTDPLNFQISLKAKYSNDLANNVRTIKKIRYNPVIIN
jgi:hypothetical protein